MDWSCRDTQEETDNKQNMGSDPSNSVYINVKKSGLWTAEIPRKRQTTNRTWALNQVTQFILKVKKSGLWTAERAAKDFDA